MKVYIVEYCVNYEGAFFQCAFSTQEKAEAYINKSPPSKKDEWFNLREVELDAEE